MRFSKRIRISVTFSRTSRSVLDMNKKHFIMLADYIKDAQKFTDQPFTEAQIEHLANFCHHVNHNFKRDRWISYIKGECGPNGGAR